MTTLAGLRSSRRAVRELADRFNLDLQRTTTPRDLFILSPALPFETIAGDGAGNVFLSCGGGEVEQRPVLVVTHEGEAGRVASSLDGLLGLVLALPWWWDVLKFSGGGKLEEMRRAAEWRRTEEVKEKPDLGDACRRLAGELGVRLPEDPVADLYREMNAIDVAVLAPDGTPFDSLFNTFKVRTPPSGRPR